MKVVVVDDERLSRQRVIKLLADHADVKVIGECADGDEAVDVIRRLRPDVVFLDVQMPGQDGLEVVRSLDADSLPTIVFVTAYDQYAVAAFEVCACDYVLKPVTRARFRATLDRLRGRIASANKPATPAAASRIAHRILLRSDDQILLLHLDEIDWIEALGNYIKIHVGPKKYLRRATLQSVESQMPPEQFCRISRSVIVNVNRIAALQSASRGDMVVSLRDGTLLKLKRKYRECLETLSIL